MGATRSFLYVWGLCPDVTPERREDLLPPRKKENTTDPAARLAQLSYHIPAADARAFAKKCGKALFLHLFAQKRGGGGDEFHLGPGGTGADPVGPAV